MATKYGSETTLAEAIEMAKGNNKFRCPKCSGKGWISVKYNGYPRGLPDSGWVYEEKWKDVECDLCKGIGWTDHEYKPRMVQDGWE